MIAGRLTAGTLSQFVLYAVFAAGALSELSQVWSEISQAAGAAERLGELLDERPAVAAPASPTPLPEPARGAVAFERVSFAYPGQPGRRVIETLDLAVRPGETVAIVGPSGAGKSTLFQLLLRYYDPQEGRVLLDGVALPAADPAAIRARLALVPQEPVVFAASAPRQYPLRPPRSERRRGGGRGPAGRRRRLHSRHAARLRDGDRRARRDPLRRPAPAHRHRPRHPEERAGAAARRGDLGARFGERDGWSRRRWRD